MSEALSPPHFIDIVQVQELARSLGFGSVGFAQFSAPLMQAHRVGLQAWTEAGHHGEMEYMKSRIEQRADPGLLLPDAQSVIMVSLDYRPHDPLWREQALDRIEAPDQANVSVYALGRDYHKIVRRRLQKLANLLCERFGRFTYRAFCDSAPVMEIPLALQSGMGWRGKHTLLLHRERGSMFFLGSLYTNLSLPEALPSASLAESPAMAQEHCGSCSQCLDVCPTQAIIAPYRLDARRCISYLTIEHSGGIPQEFRHAMGNRIYGCDDCQLVCPWNKFAKAPVHVQIQQELAPRASLEKSSLLQLWAWTEDDFLLHTEGSAIRRIGYWRWRRNLMIAMGNALRALGASHLEIHVTAREAMLCALREALTKAVQVGDEIYVEHLRWALAQCPMQAASSTP